MVPEDTHVLPSLGEATMTLQDIAVLRGLCVNGLPVILVDRDLNLRQKKLVHEVLRFYPADNIFKGDRL